MKYHQQQEQYPNGKAVPPCDEEEDVEQGHGHEVDDSEEVAMAALQVVNAVLDEKAQERDWRQRRPQHHRPITTTPPIHNSQPVSEPSPSLQVMAAVDPRRRRQQAAEHNDSTTGDVNLLQLAAERSQGVYRDTDTSTGEDDEDEESSDRLVQEKLQQQDIKKQPSPQAGSSSGQKPPPATPGAYRAAPGQSTRRTPDFDTETLGMGKDDHGLADSTRSTTTAHQREDTILLSAVRVDQDDLELHIRDEICNAAAQAQIVDLEQEANLLVEQKMHQVRKRHCAMTIALVVALMGAIVLGVLLRPTRNNDTSSVLEEHWTTYPWSTLETIRERGHLNCGLTPRDDSVNYSAPYFQHFIRLFKDICIAIAAAALDGDPNVTFVVVNERERWTALNNGTLDVLLVGTPSATESLHWNLDPNIPVQFSRPFLFDGVGVGGMPDYVTHCTSRSRGLSNTQNCVDVKVCVVQGSQASTVAESRMHPRQLVYVANNHELYTKFANGCCNLISTDYSADRVETVVRESTGYTGDYLMGDVLFSKQPYAAATRKTTWAQRISNGETQAEEEITRLEDPKVFSKFVNWVIHALIAAEENNITQATAHQFPQTNVFGEEYKDMFRHALEQVGNFGEIYARSVEKIMPRGEINQLNDGTTGLHYSRSIGKLDDYGDPPYENGTITAILNRGQLRCGIAMPRNISGATTGQSPDVTPFELERMIERLMNQTASLSSSEGTPGTADIDFMNQATTSLLEDIPGTTDIDVTICRAVASALFQGRLFLEDDDVCSFDRHNYTASQQRTILARPTFELILLQDEAEGYDKLNDGSIDVVLGYRKEFKNDVWEQTTGQGYAFSQPYFYGPTKERQVTAANRCAVTSQLDQQWSDFVFLTVVALFYAEENYIVQATANEMPIVNRFGSLFKRMYKDIVFGVGNYAEVYARSIGRFHAREGTLNQLNTEATPQIASLPGLISS